MPVWRVRVVEVAQCGDVPAHVVALRHGHQRPCFRRRSR
jgi:hypothetical protein